MGIIRLLRDAIETEVDNIDLGDDYVVTQTENVILEYADIVLPWLWRASQNGIQSDFTQSMVIFCIAESYGRRHYVCSFSIARLKIWRESGVQLTMLLCGFWRRHLLQVMSWRFGSCTCDELGTGFVHDGCTPTIYSVIRSSHPDITEIDSVP